MQAAALLVSYQQIANVANVGPAFVIHERPEAVFLPGEVHFARAVFEVHGAQFASVVLRATTQAQEGNQVDWTDLGHLRAVPSPHSALRERSALSS